MVPFALHNSVPVFPFARDFGQDITHDLRTCHQAVLLAFENANLALAHQLAEPSDVIHRHTRVFTAVVNDNGAIDVFVAEADGLFGFETDDEVGGGIGIGGRAVPDCKGKTFVECALVFAFS